MSKRSSIPFFVYGGIVGGMLAGESRLARADGELVDEAAPWSARSAEAGAFLSSALSPRAEGRAGLVSITGGWNDPRGGGTYDATAAARLFGPVSVSAGATYDGPESHAGAHADLQLHALRQGKHGVDAAFAGGYTNVGLNTVPAFELRAAIGRNIGPSYLLANAAVQVGLEENERAGALRLAALYPVTRAAHVGVDSRFQIDLERDEDEPEAEVDWEWRSDAVASYSWSRFVFTGGGGISVLRMRGGVGGGTGPVVTAGVGTVF